MVKKVVKNKSNKVNKPKVVKKTEGNIKNKLLDFNNEFKELDSALSKTKLIKLQQWLYSLIVFVLFAPIIARGTASMNYLFAIVICMFALLFSVYIAQSNRILVLLTQIRNDIIGKKNK